MPTSAPYTPRRAASRVEEALADTRVVVVNGARQVGKSTLAAVVARARDGSTLRYLDHPDVRLAAAEDPVAFLRHDGGLMVIDEVQRVPELWLALKHAVDVDPTPGRFLLTGSARLLALQSLPDSLVGRSETVELWPLSQGEIDGGTDRFVDELVRQGVDLRVPSLDLVRRDYLARAERGGFPEAVRRSTARRRGAFFDSYVADLVNRDVRQAAQIDQVADMRRLIALLAAQVGALVRPERLAGELSITGPTVKRYLQILETVFLIKRVPAWTPGAAGRAIHTPKLAFVDSGLAAHLAGGDASGRTGGLVENLVLGELGRQLTWCEEPLELYHYRDRDGYEVDAVLEHRNGDVFAIEVKTAESLRTEDFRGLRALRTRIGTRFRAGIVLYCGSEQLAFGDRLASLPISALWTA
ncbi:MAG: ATP-binding protein [Sporichthyaceae bacterium]